MVRISFEYLIPSLARPLSVAKTLRKWKHTNFGESGGGGRGGAAALLLSGREEDKATV